VAVKVTFHGACGIVTGSCFEISTSRTRILIDCGMFQGTKSVKELNYEPFSFDPKSIQALIVTHAHIDHCGLVPKLVKAGFHGPIIATPATADLLSCVLPDSGYIQESEVAHLNYRNRRRGRPEVLPIYTRADAEASLTHVAPRKLDSWIDVAAGIRIRFWDAGHILGSTSVEIHVNDKGATSDSGTMKLLFSGDIGPGEKALQGAPRAPTEVDYLFVESTYGDRKRKDRTSAQRRRILRNEIRAGLKAGGMILIPAFAIERTQEILADLDALFDAGELPVLPIFVDSPLATKTTEVFSKHLRENLKNHPTHPFLRNNVHYVESTEDSKSLARLGSGAIIMAGSGMCDAGRIRHHLKNYLGRSNTTLILVGYQAPGTLGRLISQGTKMVRIHGEEIAVSARIRMLDEYSGHADQSGIVSWIRARAPIHRGIYLIHGEENARNILADKLANAGFDSHQIHLPAVGQTERLTVKGPRTVKVRSSIDLKAVAERDWHNEYASTILALRHQLESLRGDKEKRKLLRRIQGVLDRKPR
jgi:metallo-beta-lactamase family protein